MKLAKIRDNTDPVINESFKDVHADLKKIFDWMKDLEKSKNLEKVTNKNLIG